MLLSSYGLDFGDRMYILRMHCDLDTAELVHCTDLRHVADDLLRVEYQRLLEQT